ncbi:hypothetical protein D3C71_964970 [compost metagenome]
MRFIDDDGVVLHQQAILLDFSQQNPVGHQFDHRVVADVIAKTHFIADATTRLRLQLLGNTVRHGTRRQTTRLGMTNQAFDPAAQLHTDFWQLSGFTGASLPGDNHHLVIANGFEDFLFFLTDRQVLRVFNHRTCCFTQHDFPCSLFNLFRHLLVNGLLCIRIFKLFNPVKTACEALLVAQHQRIELLHQHREG